MGDFDDVRSKIFELHAKLKENEPEALGFIYSFLQDFFKNPANQQFSFFLDVIILEGYDYYVDPSLIIEYLGDYHRLKSFYELTDPSEKAGSNFDFKKYLLLREAIGSLVKIFSTENFLNTLQQFRPQILRLTDSSLTHLVLSSPKIFAIMASDPEFVAKLNWNKICKEAYVRYKNNDDLEPGLLKSAIELQKQAKNIRWWEHIRYWSLSKEKIAIKIIGRKFRARESYRIDFNQLRIIKLTHCEIFESASGRNIDELLKLEPKSSPKFESKIAEEVVAETAAKKDVVKAKLAVSEIKSKLDEKAQAKKTTKLRINVKSVTTNNKTSILDLQKELGLLSELHTEQQEARRNNNLVQTKLSPLNKVIEQSLGILGYPYSQSRTNKLPLALAPFYQGRLVATKLPGIRFFSAALRNLFNTSNSQSSLPVIDLPAGDEVIKLNITQNALASENNVPNTKSRLPIEFQGETQLIDPKCPQKPVDDQIDFLAYVDEAVKEFLVHNLFPQPIFGTDFFDPKLKSRLLEFVTTKSQDYPKKEPFKRKENTELDNSRALITTPQNIDLQFSNWFKGIYFFIADLIADQSTKLEFAIRDFTNPKKMTHIIAYNLLIIKFGFDWLFCAYNRQIQLSEGTIEDIYNEMNQAFCIILKKFNCDFSDLKIFLDKEKIDSFITIEKMNKLGKKINIDSDLIEIFKIFSKSDVENYTSKDAVKKYFANVFTYIMKLDFQLHGTESRYFSEFFAPRKKVNLFSQKSDKLALKCKRTVDLFNTQRQESSSTFLRV